MYIGQLAAPHDTRPDRTSTATKMCLFSSTRSLNGGLAYKHQPKACDYWVFRTQADSDSKLYCH